eukprot:m.343297 g.343297  ORF g.343297 m.343297 type:complete len:446 (+) comp22659_c0_seq1:224-1561(+)
MSRKQQAVTCCVVDVHAYNWKQMYPCLAQAISKATYVAVDAEMSGIGSRKELMEKELTKRYTNMKSIATSRSLLSLGVACFSKAPAHRGGEGVMEAKVFNITLLSTASYVVEPGSLLFLSEHGFNFNKQISHGVQYTPGKEKPVDNSNQTSGKTSKSARKRRKLMRQQAKKENDPQEAELTPMYTPREVFKLISSSGAGLVLHNGLLDLMFLYQGLYDDLPPSLDLFVAHLTELFPTVFDTKYLAEYHFRESASFLEYLFRKLQRSVELKSNQDDTLGPRVEFSFPLQTIVAEDNIDLVSCPAKQRKPDTNNTEEAVMEDKVVVCKQFGAHGFCPHGLRCPRSHDVDAILDLEDDKRKRKLNNKGNDDDNEESDNDDEPVDIKKTIDLRAARAQGHRAGFDAFMTGYSFVVMKSRMESKTLADTMNKVYLSGKPRPLLLVKSKYV